MPNEYTTKRQNFENQLNNIDILILGSSHALRGINPHEFKEYTAYNMAMVSQSIQMDHDILFRYNEKMPRLKVVFISLSHFTLSKKLTDGEIYNRLPFYNFFYDLKYDELKPTQLEYYSLQSTIGFRKSLLMIWNFFKKRRRKINCDNLGWMNDGGKKVTTEKFQKEARDAVKRHEDGSLDFKNNLHLLDEIAAWADSSGKQVFFVNTPKTFWYNSYHDTAKSKRID
jgi:hypothetical protein